MTALDHDAFSAVARKRRNPIARLPDAADYAAHLPPPIAAALARAYPTRANGAPTGLITATPADAKALRPWGLCDYPGGHNPGRLLTNFGAAVRSHVIKGV